MVGILSFVSTQEAAVLLALAGTRLPVGILLLLGIHPAGIRDPFDGNRTWVNYLNLKNDNITLFNL